MATLFEQIEASASINDLDAAVLPIQQILGQDDGGAAAMFFSGPNEDSWPDASNAWRMSILRQYVAYELTLRF